MEFFFGASNLLHHIGAFNAFRVGVFFSKCEQFASVCRDIQRVSSGVFFCRGNSLQYIEAFNAFRVCVLSASNVPQYIEAFNAFWVEFFLVRAKCFSILRHSTRFGWRLFCRGNLLRYVEAFTAFRFVF